ncbi:DUF5686 and carboxypeptidase-like regulatory domain-containing protein [Ravibacter arvi]|uniref:DUF5686 and carboxypeptidase-like regulatory domain-containing protein n=1 Tax=Ravibacter arvi TaxID=2051041 RepID=A0ABP8M4C0_9BACT
MKISSINKDQNIHCSPAKACRARIFFLGLLLLAAHFPVAAQNQVVKGKITDARSKETLPFASVLVEGTPNGTMADDDGNFVISVPAGHQTLVFTYIGYVTEKVKIQDGQRQPLEIKMTVDASMLSEVTVKARGRYRNRNNPAVELIRKVIANKDSNRVLKNDYVEYEQYEKVTLALSNLSDKFVERGIFKKYQFLFEDDSTAEGNRHQLPAYMQEQVSQIYFRKNPYKLKQYIKAEKKAEYDKRFVDNDGLTSYINRLYEDIDIYKNDISIATNLLLSPLASSAPTFYKFFIRDTIRDHEPMLIELGFVPRNKADMLFEGKLYITLDGHYAVNYAYLSVNKDINLNFMRGLEAKLEFARLENNRYRPERTTLSMEFALSDRGAGVLGRRTVSFRNYEINRPHPDALYYGQPREFKPDSSVLNNDYYWTTARHVELDRTEKNIYRNVDSLQTIPSFRRAMDIATVLFAGYKSFGKVEVGPINTFYSFNQVEGFRLRFGGRTTTELSKRYYLESYAAYGFKDQKWKYFFGGTYSLNNKSVYHFPLHYIRLSYQQDTKIPGQDLQFVQEDNFLLSFKRGKNDRYLYNDQLKLEYVKEFASRFSVKFAITKWAQRPAGALEYRLAGTPDDAPMLVRELNNTDIGIELRYAPNEQFYQGKLYRTPIINKYPIYTLRYNSGVKGLMRGENTYHSVNASVFKRVYLSQLGFADVDLEGGYIFGGGIPFPLLMIHRANQTYAYQLNSYNLMNFLEFTSDHWAGVNVQYYMNGFLFNKVPLFKRLKWREVFSFKLLSGGLRNENDPAFKNGNVFEFIKDDQGRPITYTLSRQPYMEASVGVANIFKLIRVDLVKRLSYLDHPNVSEWGIRARFRLDF